MKETKHGKIARQEPEPRDEPGSDQREPVPAIHRQSLDGDYRWVILYGVGIVIALWAAIRYG